MCGDPKKSCETRHIDNLLGGDISGLERRALYERPRSYLDINDTSSPHEESESGDWETLLLPIITSIFRKSGFSGLSNLFQAKHTDQRHLAIIDDPCEQKSFPSGKILYQLIDELDILGTKRISTCK